MPFKLYRDTRTRAALHIAMCSCRSRRQQSLLHRIDADTLVAAMRSPEVTAVQGAGVRVTVSRCARTTQEIRA